MCVIFAEPRLVAPSVNMVSLLEPYILLFCFDNSSSPVGASLDHRRWISKPIFEAKNFLYMWFLFLWAKSYLLQLERHNVDYHHKQALKSLTFKTNERRKDAATLATVSTYSVLMKTQLHLFNLSLSFDFLTRGDMSKRDNWRPSKSWTSPRSVNVSVFPHWNKPCSCSPVRNACLNFILIQKLIYQIVWREEKTEVLGDDPWLFTAQTP